MKSTSPEDLRRGADEQDGTPASKKAGSDSEVGGVAQRGGTGQPKREEGSGTGEFISRA